ncbi:MAG: alpha/beta fold hydrolase [Defluviitaleaceae bacterium]|nr:alpha/beta fold hydrolase [Defluviitaleaceae bacterium]
MKLLVCVLFAVIGLLAGCSSGDNGEDIAPNIYPEGEINISPEVIPGESPTPAPSTDSEDIVSMFMSTLVAGDMVGAYSFFDDVMRIAGFTRLIELNTFVLGEFLDFSIGEVHPHGDMLLYEVTITHALGTGVYRVVVDDEGLISGFGTMGEFVSDLTETFELPSYTAEAVAVGTDWQLPGILTLPEGASEQNPVPGVVLVHGSGPHDMDTNMMGMRVFFDIADFLSENGIAVLRYNKRTFSYDAASIFEAYGNRFSVRQETIEDAVLAAEILRADPRISEVYMLGWSLGGMLAPRIHMQGGDFDGLILLAASPRPHLDIIIEQIMADMLGAMAIFGETPEITAVFEQLYGFAALADSIAFMTEEEALNTQIVFQPIISAYAYYFLDTLKYPFEEIVANANVPILALQGRNDFQILAEVDFIMLQEILGARENVQFIMYDNLDHFFMPSIAQNFREHRDISLIRPSGTRVDERVLRDITDWVLRHQ